MYEVQEQIPNILQDPSGETTKEMIINGLRTQIDKIGHSVQNNSLWADIGVLSLVGIYRIQLADFVKLVNENAIANENKLQFSNKTSLLFSNLINTCRRSSGVTFLNKKMRKLV